MISASKQLLLHKGFMTSHLRILFPLKQVTTLNYPYSAFLQTDKRRIFCLQQLELHIYIIQASKELIIFLNNIWSTWNFKWLELLNEPPLWENSTLSKFRRRSPAHLLSFIATFADMVCVLWPISTICVHSLNKTAFQVNLYDTLV